MKLASLVQPMVVGADSRRSVLPMVFLLKLQRSDQPLMCRSRLLKTTKTGTNLECLLAVTRSASGTVDATSVTSTDEDSDKSLNTNETVRSLTAVVVGTSQYSLECPSAGRVESVEQQRLVL